MSDLEERVWAVLFAEIGLLRIAEESNHPDRGKYIVKIRTKLMHIWAKLNQHMRADP